MVTIEDGLTKNCARRIRSICMLYTETEKQPNCIRRNDEMTKRNDETKRQNVMTKSLSDNTGSV